jgi:hypothetical protein
MTPTLTEEKPQHMDALEKGNDVRIARADLRNELRAGELTFRDALNDPRARGMNVWKLLALVPWWGSIRINELSLSLIRKRLLIGYGARVGSLTERQQEGMLAEVESMAHGRAKRRAANPKVRESLPAVEAPSGPNPPPRCDACKARLRKASKDGLCGFCREEREQAA